MLVAVLRKKIKKVMFRFIFFAPFCFLLYPHSFASFICCYNAFVNTKRPGIQSEHPFETDLNFFILRFRRVLGPYRFFHVFGNFAAGIRGEGSPRHKGKKVVREGDDLPLPSLEADSIRRVSEARDDIDPVGRCKQGMIQPTSPTARNGSHVPKTVEPQRDGVEELARTDVGLDRDRKRVRELIPNPEKDHMVVDRGLVPVLVIFSARARGGLGRRRRGTRGAERQGPVIKKRGRPVGLIKLSEGGDRETKHRHLLDDGFDVISAEAVGRHENSSLELSGAGVPLDSSIS
ncbi:UNVERIFIED_CONTAM: hypothetical protein Slati_3882200 [Sesamum latifolium]|uniref:Uncharacterized protein n=1 Tax=Sesamum latifolium TaxID=2727402 RepID=A0AAW2TMF8_9LAMI